MLIQDLGFKQGSASPNVFWHEQRGIRCSVHGDDFTSTGARPELDWLEAAIGERYEITIQPRMGPGRNDAKEGIILNRVVRWLDDRLEYEADPRQVERLVSECGLDGCKAVSTPGLRASFKDLEHDSDLNASTHTAFRGAAARGNYLATDRLDCQFATTEVCRFMAKPTTHSWTDLKRLVRYLAGQPRLVYVYRLQETSHLDTYTDTDWAGCPRTRKSTSGGCVLLGRHTIKHWSSTQAGVTLSSGEAEFQGVVRGAGMGLGYQALLQDFGLDVPLRVWTDSSAAIGICSRQGLGKLRHLDTHTLWLQQAVRSSRLELRKVLGASNPADLFTKHSLTRDKLLSLVRLFHCYFLQGRAASAPALRKSEGTKTTMAAADAHLGTVAENGGDGEADVEPFMPHASYEPDDLDRLHPALVAPGESDYTEQDDDPLEPLLVHGKKIAGSIAAAMTSFGRTKRDWSSKPSG